MSWQRSLFAEITARLPTSAEPQLVGSTLTRELLDGWSDLDLRLRIDDPVDLTALVGTVWAYEAVETRSGQVVRTVLADGHRVDLSVTGAGRIVVPDVAENEFRFIAGMAATRLGRGDRLIGLHLVYDLLRRCLVEAMQLRDRDEKSSVHRTGSARDALALEVLDVARMPLELSPRPNVVDAAAQLHDRWHTELDPVYVPDWSGLDRLLDRGLGILGLDDQLTESNKSSNIVQ